MEKGDIEIGKIYNISKRFFDETKGSFSNVPELYECVEKSTKGVLFSKVKEMLKETKELFVKNDDLNYNVKSVEGTGN